MSNHPTITFERYERNCPFNRTNATNPRALIRDFRVSIDGELRALLLKESSSRGYRLYDVDYGPIVTGGRTFAVHMGDLVEKQSDFEEFVLDRLAHIPTPTEAAARLAARDHATAVAAAEHAGLLYPTSYRQLPEIGEPLLAEIEALVAAEDAVRAERTRLTALIQERWTEEERLDAGKRALADYLAENGVDRTTVWMRVF